MQSNRMRKLKFFVIVFFLFALVLILPRFLVEISNLEAVQNLCLGPATEESNQGVLSKDFWLDLLGPSRRNMQQQRSEQLLTFWSDLFIPIFSLGISISVFVYERNNELQHGNKAKYDWLMAHFCVGKDKPILLKKQKDPNVEGGTGLCQKSSRNKDFLETLYIQFPECEELLIDAVIKLRKATLEVKKTDRLFAISTGKISCIPISGNTQISSRDLCIAYRKNEKWINSFLSSKVKRAKLEIKLEIDVAFKLTSNCRAYVTYVVGKDPSNLSRQECYVINKVDCELI